MECSKVGFGRTSKGEETGLYTFANKSGMRMAVSDYGATLISVVVKGADGRERDVVLGYDDVSGYEDGTLFLGATVGRNANRIGGAVFEIAGKKYELEKNDNANNLHSGSDFYGKRLWRVEKTEENSITFSLRSPHMDQGYPGNLKAEVAYTLTDENEIIIEYRAAADRDTIINLTNHSYFNMDGHNSGSVLGQLVWIDADRYTDTDNQSIPTGELTPVVETPMDFRRKKTIGEDIEKDYRALRFGQGYDHNYVLNGEGFRKAASMESSESGIRMTVYTDLPGLQLYTANFLTGEKGKNGAAYPKRSAACFETQYFPDAVNHRNFESPIFKKGQTYHTKTAYKFEVID